MKTNVRRAIVLSVFALGIAASARAAEDNPFDAPILDIRPRIFLRRDHFEGLTV